MERKSLNFNAKIKPVKPLNDEFSLCKIYVQGVGKNRNYSYMSKKSILKNIGTLAYNPVVGHLLKDEEGNTYFGSHDYELTCDENGLKFESLTVPFGVVCENQYDFETINEYGTDVEYLVSNAILWTGRYPQLKEAIYSDETWFNQSMEINPTQTRPYADDSNYTEILDWTYSALCILGKADENSTNGKTEPEMHSEPCFINSKIEPYNFSTDEFSKLFADMKNEISLVFENINTTQEGGLPLADEKNIENEVAEEVEVTVDDEVNEEVIDAPESDNEDTDEIIENDDLTEEIIEENVSEEPSETEIIDKSEYELLVTEFEDYKLSHTHTNDEFEVLEKFKQKVTDEKRKTDIENTFAKFDKKLSGFAEYESLKTSEITMDIADLEEKLFAMIGKKTTNFSVHPKETVVTVPVEIFESTDDDGYGGILAKRYNN